MSLPSVDGIALVPDYLKGGLMCDILVRKISLLIPR